MFDTGTLAVSRTYRRRPKPIHSPQQFEIKSFAFSRETRFKISWPRTSTSGRAELSAFVVGTIMLRQPLPLGRQSPVFCAIRQRHRLQPSFAGALDQIEIVGRIE
jgi:hypothetical protein